MAMTLISEQVLGSTTQSITFTNIPQTYKDLVIEVLGKSDSTTDSGLYLRFNNDTANAYSETYLFGSGSSASSGRSTNQSTWIGFGDLDNSGTANVYSYFTHNVMSYASSSIYKTVLSRFSAGNNYVNVAAILYRSTSPITSILLSAYTPYGRNIAAGSVFRLWGVA